MSENAPVVSIVLPMYNERANVESLLGRLAASMRWPFELIVVDDDSPDGTAEEVRRVTAEMRRSPEQWFPLDVGARGTAVQGQRESRLETLSQPQVRLIVRREEHGLTSAIQRGIDESRGDVVVWMDCDLSMPPEMVPELVSRVIDGSADAAVGSRYVEGGAAEAGGPDGAVVRIQKLATRLMNRIIAALTGAHFHDWTSGFIAVRAPLVKGIRLEGDYGEYFIRLAATLIAGGARVVEVPYRCVPREHGESKTATSLIGLLRRGTKYARALWWARRTLRDFRTASDKAPGY